MTLHDLLPWPRAHRRLLWVALLDAFGTGALAPVTVIFFTTTRGASVASVALALGIGAAAGVLATPLAGAAIDRFGALRFAVTSYIAAAVTLCGYLLARGAAAVALAIIAVQVVEHISRPGRVGVVAEIADAHDPAILAGSQRTLRNLGYALGGLVAAAGLALGTGAAYSAIIILDIASFLVAATLMAPSSRTVRRAYDPRPRTRLVVVRDWRFMSLVLVDATILIQKSILLVGIPIWLLRTNHAPRALAGLVFLVNAVLVVLLQLRANKRTRTTKAAGYAYAAAGGSVALTCLVLGAMKGASPLAISLGLIGAVVVLSVGEVLTSAAQSRVSFSFGAARSRGRYLAAMATGASVQGVVGPPIVAAVATGGRTGWIALALGLACIGGTAPLLVGVSPNVRRSSARTTGLRMDGLEEDVRLAERNRDEVLRA